MIPVARKENILITEVDNEMMIYDRARNACHCLNPIATKVYEYADGRNTIDDIAAFIKEELVLAEDIDIRGLVWLALEELEKCNLIKEYRAEPLPDLPEISRRKVLGKTAKLAGAAGIGVLFPMVKSVIAPKPAMAASGPTPTPPRSTPPITTTFICSSTSTDGTNTCTITCNTEEHSGCLEQNSSQDPLIPPSDCVALCINR